MSILLRTVKGILRLVGYVALVAVILVVVAVLLVGFTTFGGRFAADQVARLASTPDRIVTIGTPSGLLTGRLRLDQVTLADTQGTFAEIRDIAVDWSPLALFGGTLKADLVSAGSLGVSRAPVVTVDPPADRGGSSLPVAIDIDRLSLPDIQLGAPLAGRDFALAAEGALTADSERIDAELTASRNDQPQAKAAVDFAFAPAENRLTLDADITEPAGGLIAGLLRLPGAPAVAFNIKGEGPLSDWAGKLAAAIDGKPVLNLNGRHQVSTAGLHHVILKGGGSFETLLPPAFRPLFSGNTEIDLAGDVGTDGRVIIENGTLTTGSLLLAASGELNPSGENSLKANLIGTAGPVDFRWPLASGNVRALITGLDLAVTGQASAARLSLTAALDAVELPQGRLGKLKLEAGSDALDLATRTGTIDTRLTVEETAFTSPDIDRAVRAPLTVTAPIALSPTSIGFETLAIESGSIGGTVNGRFDLTSQTVDAAFKLFAVPAILPPGIAAKFGTTIAAEGQATATIGGRTQVSGLTVTSDIVEASGSASLENGVVNADLQGRVPDIGKLVAGARGAPGFTLTASGPLSALPFKAAVNADTLTLAGRDITALALAAEGTAGTEATAAALTLTGALSGQAFGVDGQIAFADGALSLPKLTATVGTNRIDGALAFSPEFQPQGNFAIDLPELATLAAMAGQTIDGNLKGTAAIIPDTGKLTAAIELAGDAIRRDTVSIVKPTITIAIDDIAALSARATIHADEVAAGNTRLPDVTLVVNQTAGTTGFDLRGTLDESPLILGGTVASAAGNTTITLASLVASPRTIPVTLAEPATITIASGTVNIPKLAIDAGGGSVTLIGSAGETLGLAVRIADLPANLANSLVSNLIADGTLSGTIAIRGTPAAAIADVDMTAALSELDIPQGKFGTVRLTAQTTGFDIASLSGTLATRLTVDATALTSVELDRAIRGPLALSVPLVLSSGAIRFDGTTIASSHINGTIDGRYDMTPNAVTAAFKLSLLPAALPPAVAAKFTSQIDVEGEIASTIGGRTDLTGLKVRSDTLEAAGTVALEDSKSLTASLTGRLPDIGKLIAGATGEADLALSATGPLAALATRATISSASAMLAGRALTDLQISAEGVADMHSPKAVVKATGALGGQAISLDATLDSDNGVLRLPTLLAVVGPNRLEGQLAFSPTLTPEGTLTFDLPDIGLIAALAGQQAEGDLKGSATIGARDGKIQATVVANGSGIRSNALDIGKPAIDLTIDDLQALSAKGTIRADTINVGNNRIAGLTVDITQASGTTDFNLKATYDDAPLVAVGNARSSDGTLAIGLDRLEATPQGIPLQLADPTTITVAAGTVTVPALTIRAGAGRITVDGTAGDRMALDIRIADLPAGLANTFVADLKADGTINGTAAVRGTSAAPVATFDVTATLASVAMPQGRFETIDLNARSDRFEVSTRSGVVETRLTVAGTAFTSPDLDRAIRGPLTVAGPIGLTPDFVTFDRLTLDSANIGGSVNGRYDIATRTVTAGFDASIQPAALPEAAASRFDKPIDASGALSAAIGDRTEVTGLTVRSGTIEANGDAALESGNILTASLKGRLPDLGKLLADAKGQATFTVSASGPIAALLVKATVAADKAMLGGRELTDLAVTADATADLKAPQATLKASGALGGQTINVDADVTSKDGITEVPKLLAEVGRNRLEGALSFSPGFEPQGKLTFDLPDLGLFAALAGQKAEGDLKGTVDLSTRDGKIRATVAASGSGIRRDDLRVIKPAVDLQIDDLAAFAAQGTVRADEIASGTNRITGLALAITQSAGKTGFDLKASYDGAPLTAVGNVRSANGAITVALDSFAAAPRKIPLRLENGATISIADGGVTISKLGIRAGAGQISVTGSSGAQLALDIRITNLPASLANTFAPTISAEGTISGTAAVRGSASAPSVDYDLTWANAAVAQTKSAGIAAFNVKANGSFADNVLRIETALSGGGGLTLNGGGTVGVTGNQALSLAFQGRLPFALAAAQLSAQGLSLDGSANVDLRIAGTASAPVITGTVTADGATLVDVRRNIALNDIGLAVTFDRDRATISRLSGRLAQGGTVSASGTIGITGSFPADLAVKLDKAAYVDGQLLATVIDGNLTLQGPLLTSPVLGGTLRLGKTSITVPEKLPASLAEINVKHKNAPRDVLVQAEKIKKDEGGGQGAQSSIGLDLTISAPSQIFVRGRGIDAELGGSLTVRGTAADPVVSGGFDMRRGRLNILNKRLDFTNGEISFGGSLTPTLNLEATNTTGSTAITVTVAGVANDPAITFASSPALPQDEILAQLIFGQSMSKLSALQIAQLADAASQLAGGRSTSLFQALRSNLGVDDLDISTDEKGQARVSAGKYLNSRTYIELQGGGDSGGRAVINLDVGRGVKLRGSAGGNGEGAAGIFYEKEY